MPKNFESQNSSIEARESPDTPHFENQALINFLRNTSDTQKESLNSLTALQIAVNKSSLSSKEKKDINHQLDRLSENDLKNLVLQISRNTQNEIAKLNEAIREWQETAEDIINDANNNSFLTNKLPEKIVKRIKNPKNLGDNILGGAVGLGFSAEEIVKIIPRLCLDMWRFIVWVFKK